MLPTVKLGIDYFLESLFQPIKSFLKSQRINALANVVQGTKNIPAGHRACLRAITFIELEFGMRNEKNMEVQEGLIPSLDSLIVKPETTQQTGEELGPKFNFKAQADEILQDDEDEEEEND